MQPEVINATATMSAVTKPINPLPDSPAATGHSATAVDPVAECSRITLRPNHGSLGDFLLDDFGGTRVVV